MENKGNIVLELKDYLNQNYDLKRTASGAVSHNGKDVLEERAFNSLYLHCKTALPKTTKDLLRTILYSDFVKLVNRDDL
jgi:hypothetical protein